MSTVVKHQKDQDDSLQRGIQASDFDISHGAGGVPCDDGTGFDQR